jgi:hypothetical protein
MGCEHLLIVRLRQALFDVHVCDHYLHLNRCICICIYMCMCVIDII